MPNTIRTEAELLALFIDNNLGLISAQDMRDFVVSCRIGQSFQGPPGPQGFQGGFGNQGFQGRAGPQGAQGAQSSGGGGAQGFQGYQGFQGEGGSDDLYTNAEATPVTIGGIPSGSTFLDQTMQQMWDALLYPYQYPAFSAFSISGQNTLIEVGVTISGSKTFLWSTTNSSNVQSNSIIIKDVTNTITLATGLANDGSEVIALPTPIQKTTQATHQWGIEGTNTNASIFTGSFTVSWLWRMYYGPSTNTTLTETNIEALANSGLASGFSGTFAYAGGGYKYFCFPDSFGSPVSFKDASTNLNVAMASSIDDAFYSNIANGLYYGLVSVTNTYSQTTNYRVYRSKNILGGSISIIVA
jgi:hypothetical protein